MYSPLLKAVVCSPVEVRSLSWAKNFSPGYQPQYLQGWPSKAHDTHPNIIPNLVFLSGRLFAGARKGVGGRNNCGGPVEGVHAKTGFRMDGFRSICTPLISLWSLTICDTGECDSQQLCLPQMSRFSLSRGLLSSLRAPRTHGSNPLLLRLRVPSHWCLALGASSQVYCLFDVIAPWWPRIPEKLWAAIFWLHISELIVFKWYYLHGMKLPVVGLEPLAIVFSLNYALLMWSYVIFISSVLWVVLI